MALPSAAAQPSGQVSAAKFGGDGQLPVPGAGLLPFLAVGHGLGENLLLLAGIVQTLGS
jgi:hypothetical protein